MRTQAIPKTRISADVIHLKKYRGYQHIDKDPMLDEVITRIDDSGMSPKEISEISGVSVSTINNWCYGTTRRPLRVTMEFVLRAIGYRLAIVPLGRGVKR